MNALESILFPGLAVAVGLSLPAQSPQDRLGVANHLVGGPGSVLRQSHGIALEGGVLWGFGPDYKASFTGGGMEYTPALGPQAPGNQPLRITLQSIARGARVLYQAGAGPAPKAVQAGDAVIYHRTPRILERFDVRADGVELSYTFAGPLPGSGDLVVRARIDTDLAFRSTAEGGIRFLLDRVGGVTIGGVTGCDATGAEVAGNLRWDGGRLEMRLPASFVDHAVHPLVLDPLVGTQLMGNTGGWNDADPSAAYDATHDEYLVVWRRIFSATDSDIRAQRISGSGTLLGSFIAVSLTGIGMKPTVANVSLRDRFLVAWQQAPSPFGPWDIFCRAVDAGTGSTSGAVAVANTAADETDPDAASENGADDEALLVWREELGGIKGTTVNLLATGNPMVQTIVTITNDTTASLPAISTSQPSGARYVVVWVQPSLFGTSGLILARAVTRDMGLLGSELILPSVGGILANDRPDVDGDGTRFMVVFDNVESAGTSDRDVWCQMIRWTGTDLATDGSGTVVADQANDDEFDPAVGWLNGKYVVLWTDRAGTFNYDIEGAELDASCRPCGNAFVLTGLNNPSTRNLESDPDIATRAAGGSASDHALIVFGEADWNPPFTSDIVAQRIQAFGGGTVTNLGGGCGNGGTAGASGSSALGNGSFGLTLSGAAPAAPFLFVGIDIAGGTSPPCGGCTIMNALAWFFRAPTGPGSASFPLPIPCDPGLQGLSVYSQWAVFQSGVSPCALVPSAAQASFSNRLRSTIAY